MALITAKHVGVEFPIFNVSSRSLKKQILNFTTGGRIYKHQSSPVTIKALDDLNFEFKDGDRIGLFGHNGAGKSTLLRVLAQIYEPTSGSLIAKGRVLSLLDIFLGMEMESSGWVNIYLRGLLLGFTPKEIKARVDAIAEFSGLDEYLNMPIRTYSSGMLMRLAFSIVTSMHVDILLMDEWLSVGDADFIHKAEKRMKEVVDKSSILVIASHSIELLNETCNKILYLEHGKISKIEVI
jgi:lipopolysaccharide transport system ATP-binding protein